MSDLDQILQDNTFTSQLVNALPCGILIINEGGKIVTINNVIEHIVGVKNAEVIGQGFGKALCCINSCEDKDECGSINGCKNCEVRKPRWPLENPPPVAGSKSPTLDEFLLPSDRAK